jgi:hypothetical protein
MDFNFKGITVVWVDSQKDMTETFDSAEQANEYAKTLDKYFGHDDFTIDQVWLEGDIPEGLNDMVQKELAKGQTIDINLYNLIVTEPGFALKYKFLIDNGFSKEQSLKKIEDGEVNIYDGDNETDFGIEIFIELESEVNDFLEKRNLEFYFDYENWVKELEMNGGINYTVYHNMNAIVYIFDV